MVDDSATSKQVTLVRAMRIALGDALTARHFHFREWIGEGRQADLRQSAGDLTGRPLEAARLTAGMHMCFVEIEALLMGYYMLF
jgi:hypothetical protein